ncbi:uncharacterized protein LOC119188382 [Manduca sexta]|uniref:uncharacterized protein LOC119188382 n=1 Tax=Manduca sexta TaxID=7130 RepID=UPI00188FB9DA|nr:uncharacterized protein LOC119188382 [Manduca sexta]
MARIILKLTLLMMFYIALNNAKMMRNSALISKMVSHFQGKDNLSIEPATENPKPGNVVSIMQNVLCRNFPSIPCSVIVRDEKLNSLIEKSIQQLKYKKMSMGKTTPLPGSHLTLFPVINSEDLSNFLQVSETGYYKERKETESTKRKQKKSVRNWSREKPKKKKKKESKVMSVYNGRKKIRRFYPHKIKYKDKNVRRDFESDEKLSMSVEVPDNTGRKISYQTQHDSPVWRIDYMKHGEPSLNMFGYENERLQGKIMKTGPNVIVDENVLEQVARKDVLHPDVYIKKNYVRKKTVDVNSDGID